MSRLFGNLFAIGSGILAGALAILIHNFYIGWLPLGLIVGLLGCLATSQLIGVQFGRRGVRFWFVLGWTVIALRAATFGNGDELLIMANGAGNTFLGLGFLLMVISIWVRL